MGLELENPSAFLSNALLAIQEYADVTNSLSEENDILNELSKSLDTLDLETEEKIEKTIKTRSLEIKDTYDRQITQLEQKIKRVKSQREKAKAKGVKGRIDAETDGLKVENTELKRQFRAMLKRDGTPKFYGSNFFYMLFRPSTPRDFLALLLAFVLCFVLLPIGIFQILPEKSTIALHTIYILDILILGGLYVFIGNIRSEKYAVTLQEGQQIKKRIRRNLKKIRSITRSIQSDTNEDIYELGAYDESLAQIQVERKEVIAKKQAAQNTFESVTKNIIRDEIETASLPKRNELEESFRLSQEKISALEAREKDLSLSLSRDYEQYLGKTHMNEPDILLIRSLLESGDAQSIIDAVSMLEHPDEVTESSV